MVTQSSTVAFTEDAHYSMHSGQMNVATVYALTNECTREVKILKMSQVFWKSKWSLMQHVVSLRWEISRTCLTCLKEGGKRRDPVLTAALLVQMEVIPKITKIYTIELFSLYVIIYLIVQYLRWLWDVIVFSVSIRFLNGEWKPLEVKSSYYMWITWGVSWKAECTNHRYC